MTSKRQLLKNLTGVKVTIYTVEKEFTGTLREDDNEFIVSTHKDTVRLTPSDIVDMKRLSTMPLLFVHNHFPF